MSTSTILLLINASFFFCIIGITIGIVIFNWGQSVKIKQYRLNGVLLILANGLLIYLFCVPMSIKYTEKLFLEKEYSGAIVEKNIEKHNHNAYFVYIIEFNNQEKISVALKKEAYKKIAIGDTLTKLVSTDYLLLKNKRKEITISRNQLIAP